MTLLYDKYKGLKEWTIIEKALNDLVKNNDLELTTNEDYVVGYILKKLIDETDLESQKE